MTATEAHSRNPAAQTKEVSMALSSSSVGIVAKFSTIAGGAWIEDLPGDHVERTGMERVWRFDAAGRAEWCRLADLTSGNPAPRWFGHQYTARDFILC